MKNRGIRSYLNMEWSQNKRGYLFTGLLLLTGIIIGCILQSVSRFQNDTALSESFSRFFQACTLTGIETGQVFRISMLQYGKLLFLLFLSGWSVFLLPVGFLQIVLKGTNLGFTAGYFISCFGMKGGAVFLITVLPQQFMLLPVLSFYMVHQIKFATIRRQFKKGGSLLSRLYLQQFLCTLFVAAIMLLCSLIEGFASPPLLGLLCGMLQP